MRIPRFVTQNAPWLLAGGFLAFLSGFGQTYFISIFAGEIRAEFNLSHGQWGGIYTLGTSISALVMVWAGGLTDIFRARSLGSVVLIILALACVSMSLAQASWVLVGVIFFLRLLGQGMLSHIAVVSVSRWFVATRGKALMCVGLGFSIGEATLPVSFVAAMKVLGWRELWLVAAGISILAIPLLWTLLKTERTPQSMADTGVSLGMAGRHWSRPQAFKHWLFWFMVPALLGPAAFSTAFFFNQVYFASVKGIEHIQLVAFFPLFTAVSVISMIISGWLLDKFGTARLIPWFQLPMVIAFGLFGTGQSPLLIALGLVFMGMTAGANTTLPNAFWAEFYGTRCLGSIKAMAAAVMVLGSALGPGLTGVLIDLDVGIQTQYLGAAGYFLFTSALMAIGVGRARPLLAMNS
ncbi:MFS transporter [Primorskyibacter marinus]|uniref:MFS transporter n=1 Tax=Primorskyibacter marinus TaxID=1977320 RepID=UPI000E300F6D|nr:MFS transporter [Primorskyibacter marinus]